MTLLLPNYPYRYRLLGINGLNLAENLNRVAQM
jgi:hypothetical protein